MAHCDTLLIDLLLGEHLQILGERRGVSDKVEFVTKTNYISETKQSSVKVTTECLETLVRPTNW